MSTNTPTEVANNLLYDFCGDYSDAIAYCAKIAGMGGPLAEDYRQAARIIKAKALSGNHSNQHLFS